MEVICPKCRKQLQASGSEGTRVICPHCRVTITLAATQRRPLATLEDPMFTPSGPTVETSVVTRRVSDKACPYCGKTILAAAKKCKHCGEFLDGLSRQVMQPAPLYSGRTPTRTTQHSSAGRGKAIASLVLGLVGLLVFGIITGIIAIALGCSARNDMRATGNYDASGMATAGIVLGIIDICGFFLWLALL